MHPTVPSPRRRETRWILAVAAVYLYFPQVYANFSNPSETTRLLLVKAVVDHHTFTLDAALAGALPPEDVARRNGHVYADKAPGLAMLAAPVYFAATRLARVSGHTLSDNQTLVVLRWATVTLPGLLALYCLAGLWVRLGIGLGARRLALVAYALGTGAYPFAILFFDHQASAALLILAWSCGIATRRGMLAAFGSGFIASLAAVSEYPVALLVLVLLIYLAVQTRGLRARAALLLGSTLPVAGLLLYHALCFGHPLTTGYAFKATPAFQTIHAEGLSGIVFPPRPAIVREILVGPARGLFFLSPWLLLAVPGAVVLARRRHSRAEALLVIAATSVYLTLIGGFLDWKGGWSVGPRHLVPLLPFLATAAACALDRLQASTGWAGTVAGPATLAAVAVSVAQVSIATATFPLFPSRVTNPLYELSLPLFVAGHSGPALPEILSRQPWPAWLRVAPWIAALTLIVGAAMASWWRPLHHAPRRRFALAAAVPLVIVLVLGLGRWQRAAPIAAATGRAVALYARGDWRAAAAELEPVARECRDAVSCREARRALAKLARSTFNDETGAKAWEMKAGELAR